MGKIFIYGSAVSGNHFTGREEETRNIINNIEQGINTIIISPRKWGKTSLMKEVKRMIGRERRFVYLDLFACRTEQDFYREFATAVLQQTASNKLEWAENVHTFLSNLAPKISLGNGDISEFILSLDFERKEHSELEIFNLPERIAKSKGIQVVVCLDEYQQVAGFKNPDLFQERLRSIIQMQESVSYCMCGCKKHLMSKLFEKQNLPFYKSENLLYMEKISRRSWISFIRKRFTDSGKYISDSLAGMICDYVDCQSSYVQQLSNLVWNYTLQMEAREEQLEQGLLEMMEQNSVLYQRETEYLSAFQMNFLKAIAEGVSKEFSTKETLKLYDLGTSANVSRLKKALSDRELVSIAADGEVSFMDPVLKLWFTQTILKKCVIPMNTF